MALVCVVDGYSSGALYAPELRLRGHTPIHVQSAKQIGANVRDTFRAQDYERNIIFDGDFPGLADSISALRPACVIAGFETGVAYADRLSEALGLATTNGTALSPARRNKYEMQRRISELGIRAIPSFATASWDEMERWVAAHLPVVVKPMSSAGTDNVIVCRSIDRARVAFDRILGAINSLGERNNDVLVQTLVVGDEYIIDTVSREAEHAVVAIWKMVKNRGEHPIYDYADLVAPDTALSQRLLAYARRVLDALGIRFGPAHLEVFVDRDGPVLIEVGARQGGGQIQRTCQHAHGFSQTTVALDAYLAPNEFAERVRSAYPVPPHIRRVWLATAKTGTLAALPRIDDARALASYHRLDVSFAPGDAIVPTTDMDTTPGYVDLVHTDDGAIEADTRAIRQWEMTDFYRLVGE